MSLTANPTRKTNRDRFMALFYLFKDCGFRNAIYRCRWLKELGKQHQLVCGKSVPYDYYYLYRSIELLNIADVVTLFYFRHLTTLRLKYGHLLEHEVLKRFRVLPLGNTTVRCSSSQVEKRFWMFSGEPQKLGDYRFERI